MVTSGVSEGNATSSYSASSIGRIADGAAVVITERLAETPDLALPSSLYKDPAHPPSPSSILAYLQALLQKDPAAFLARYGNLLQSQELNHFEPLRSGDLEVAHWLAHFAERQQEAADQAANPGRLPARVKNRRLAAMRRLAAQGEYFSDEAMRDRAPLLYHQQVGRFVEQHDQQQRQPQQQEGQQRSGPDEERQGQEQLAPVGAIGGSCLAMALLSQTAGLQASDPADAGPARPSTNDPLGARDGPLVNRAHENGAQGPSGAASADGSLPAVLHSAPGTAAGVSGPGGPDAEGGVGGQRLAARMGPGGGEPGGLPARGDEGPGQMAAGAVVPGPGAERPSAPAAAAAGAGPSQGPRAGATELLLSELLMRQDDEAQLLMRRMREQQEEDAQMSEHDSDDEVEGDGAEDDGSDEGMSDEHCGDGRQADHGEGHARGRGRPSTSAVAEMRRNFLSEMESRFLLGQDGLYVDYGTIDADVSLDGDWLEQESRDAEEKYFDED